MRSRLRAPLKLLGLLAISLLASFAGAAAGQANTGFTQDFDEFCRFVSENYAYFDIKKTRWDGVCAAYRVRAADATDKLTMISVLERALGELYDHHAHLGTSTKTSPRLVPSGADAWAAWDGGGAMIKEVRAGSAAERAGLRAGMQVMSIDGQPIVSATGDREPRFLSEPDDEARSWALQSALAGRQDGQPIRLSVLFGGQSKVIEYVPSPDRAAGPMSVRRLDGDVGYIKLNNSLGDTLTVKAFDVALDIFKNTKGLILDLRDTPSGGNSLVARGIMGRMVQTGLPYQVHELVAEARATGIRRRWIEYVMPRGEAYTAPVVVLVGRWTGSMGEGLAIGLNAVRGAQVIGTPMARLLGALGEMTLPVTGIVVRIPTEKLYHVNGTPREAFVPCLAVSGGENGAGQDDTLRIALVTLAMARDPTPAPSLRRPQPDCAGVVR
jgi:C-terminal processing protease CtpA/Prc